MVGEEEDHQRDLLINWMKDLDIASWKQISKMNSASAEMLGGSYSGYTIPEGL